jgi:FixJ family two-component response regulator
LISGYSDKVADVAAGFDFIAKPFLPETILNAIEKAMNSRVEQVLHAGDPQ